MGVYKLVALDMDGTLLNHRGEISEANARAIRDALDAGVAVCFATGRGYPHVISYAEQLGLSTPMVTVNGGEVWSNPGQLHTRHLLDRSVVRKLHDLVVPYGIWYWGYSTEGVHNRDDWVDDLESLDWLKFGIHTENDSIREEIFSILESWGGLEITNSSPHNLEINPEGVSKASGIREVCRLLEIDMRQVIAMGDSLNDISMILEAGLGIAMGNAQEAVKQAADEMTAANDDDGVAQAIRRFVLR